MVRQAVRRWRRFAQLILGGIVSELIVYGGSGLSNVDGKGRTTIPSEIRKSVETSSAGNMVCVARHPKHKCLVGFGRMERTKLRSDIERQWDSAISRGDEFDRELAGITSSSIFETVFEPSGRFVLHPMLKHFGGIDGQLFMFGATTHFMLWNPEIFLSEAPEEYSHVREELDYWINIHGKGGK